MTPRQRLELRQAELRQRLAEIGELEGDAYTEEIRGEESRLQVEFRELQPRIQSAIIAEANDPDHQDLGESEGAELRQLHQRASLGRLVGQILQQRAQDGAEAELQQHYELPSDSIPLALLEERAAGSATAPATTGANQQPIEPVLFPRSVAAFLGVEMPRVPVGQAVFPIMTAPSAAPDSANKGATVADATGTFSASALSPRRLQQSFTYSREDAALFAGMDAALRMNLNDAIAAGLDKAILQTAATGLLAQSAGAAASVPSAATTYAQFLAAFHGAVDGIHAAGIGEIRAAVGSASYSRMAGQYRANSADVSAYDSLQAKSGGIMVSAHIPAPAAKSDGSTNQSNIQQAILARAVGRRPAVAPMWDGVQVLVDPYTESQDGNIRLTAVMLYNFAVQRSGGFVGVDFKTA